MNNEYDCFFSAFYKLLRSIAITTILLLLGYVGFRLILLVLVAIQHKA